MRKIIAGVAALILGARPNLTPGQVTEAITSTATDVTVGSLEKQLRKNGRRPPGLQERLTPYPAELVRRLPPPAEHYEGGFLHGRVVIFNKSTSTILDAFIPWQTISRFADGLPPSARLRPP